MVGASCKVLNLDIDTILEVFGSYFMEYVRDEGYLSMLTLLGGNLREWLTNVNDLHKHLKNSLPDATFPGNNKSLFLPDLAKKYGNIIFIYIFLDFFCAEDEESDGIHESMILHYYSHVSSSIVLFSYFNRL